MPGFVIEVRESFDGKPPKWKPIAIGQSLPWPFDTREKAERAKEWLYPQNPPWVRVAPRL